MEITKQINQEIDYSRQYKRWHSETHEHAEQIKNLYRENISRFLPEDKEIHVLDVGCGMGFAMMFLQDLGYASVEGIDVDYAQVQSCLSKKLNVTQVEDSNEFLYRMSGRYDLIIALDVIEHIPHERQLDFVRAIQGALKPGGKIICTVPNGNSPLASRWRYIDWTHYSLFTEYSLDFLLYNAGFDNIEVHGIEYFHPPQIPPFFSRAIFKKSLWNSVLSKGFQKSLLHWQLFKVVRFWHRIVMIAELGWEQGMVLPISPNILATGVKRV
jgi:2-polyprenyl-3-methyl-5-hydroxy-6-metoxy-1,4-benzoquinol methylase